MRKSKDVRCASNPTGRPDQRCFLITGHPGLHRDMSNTVAWQDDGGIETTQSEDMTVTEYGARSAVVNLLRYIGEDPDREGLRDTPKRVVKAWDELTCGYGADPSEILSTDFHGDGYDQMVVCKKIRLVSTCEHHLLPFTGFAWVGYVPDGRVVGLSKMARLVHCFARRLQIQEKLTKEVAQAMLEHLKPKGVGVKIEAVHSCMSCRGVMEPESSMVTCSLLGVFKQHKVREEFFLHCT